MIELFNLKEKNVNVYIFKVVLQTSLGGDSGDWWRCRRGGGRELCSLKGITQLAGVEAFSLSPSHNILTLILTVYCQLSASSFLFLAEIH